MAGTGTGFSDLVKDSGVPLALLSGRQHPQCPPHAQVPRVSPLPWAAPAALEDSVRQTLSTEGQCSPGQDTAASGSTHEKGQREDFRHHHRALHRGNWVG